ncbi:MAG: hypothetical protein HYR96_09535 [Deltaproteobacteria bacterium]|nr:hypothetical protein [Deltaproteobacteria bacterium]
MPHSLFCDDNCVFAPATKYIPWGLHQQCLIRKVFHPHITICVEGAGDHDRAKEMATRALMMWVEPLRIANTPLSHEIEFDCQRPDGWIVVKRQWEREHTQGNVVTVSDQSAFGTYLHEFGHAFACIGDTYVNGLAGHCLFGQPHSVMCDGLLRKDLSDDDIKAVRFQFRTLVQTLSESQSDPNDDNL